MKNLEAGTPCNTGISPRGGGHRRSSRSLNWLVGSRSASKQNVDTILHPSGGVSREAQSLDKVESAGVDLREAGQAGEHNISAVVSENVSEANTQISQKHCMLLGKFDRRKKRRSSRFLNWLVSSRSALKQNNKRALARIKGLLPHSPIALLPSRAAFTMAEILLSLTIIGVVAAITLPSLTGNINERTWNTQRKALYARFSQALSLMPNLNGYGIVHVAGANATGSAIAAEDTATETFVTQGLSKVLKINNICDSEHLADCGIPKSVTDINGNVISNFNTSPYNTLVGFNSMFNGTWNDGGSNGGKDYTYSQLDTKAAAFETGNGESIVVYYNPNCVADLNETVWHYMQPKMCANFVYDLNGNKGPNTVGKDIGFITALYPSDPVVVAPIPLKTNAGFVAQTDAGAKCKKQDSESRVPNSEELAAMFYNRTLIGIESGTFWSSSLISSGGNGYAWRQFFHTGHLSPYERFRGTNVRCIKR